MSQPEATRHRGGGGGGGGVSAANVAAIGFLALVTAAASLLQ